MCFDSTNKNAPILGHWNGPIICYDSTLALTVHIYIAT